MKAIILAAGQGTRLKKYTENLPKGMLRFCGKTIIERQIEAYRRHNVEDIIVVTGFAADKITYEGVKYYHNKDFASTNMVESMLQARAEFDSDIIVSYSDILFSENMLKGMIEGVGDFAVAVDTNWRAYWRKRYGQIDFDMESLTMDKTGCITSLGLPDPPLSKIDARYVGLIKFSKEGLTKILSLWDRDYSEYLEKPWQQSGKYIRQAYMTDLLNALIDEGEEVRAVEFSNGWIEFDINEDYENACRWVEDGSIKDLIML